jgi:hypothetical protein
MVEEGERRGISPMDVVEHKQERPPSRGMLDRLDERIVHSQAAGLGVRYLAQFGRLRAERFDERGIRMVELALGAAGKHSGAAGVYLGGEAPRKATLADSRLADDKRNTDATVCERRPGRRQPCKGRIPADEPRPPALRTQPRWERRLLADRGAAGAQRGGQIASRRRGGKAELPAEARPQTLVDGKRSGRLAAAGERAHQVTMGRLVERVELGATPGRGEYRRRIGGRGGHSGKRRAPAVAMPVARLQNPVVVEVREQLAPRELERLLRLACVEKRVERARVDPPRPPRDRRAPASR